MTMFSTKLAQLKDDLITQGNRVVDMTLRAVESYFELDQAKAAEVVRFDEIIDKTDVEIERASIPLLAMGETDEHAIRCVLTIVKVNNELERIADCAVSIAEAVADLDESNDKTPLTFRMMANSVIGMLRDANKALAESDTELAKRVLAFDDTVDRFKVQIGLDAEEKVASGEFEVRFAFRLRTVTKSLERIADHCTNICEQVIYLESGRIVRHNATGWTDPVVPES
jgi:phosphate transport system protein